MLDVSHTDHPWYSVGQSTQEIVNCQESWGAVGASSGRLATIAATTIAATTCIMRIHWFQHKEKSTYLNFFFFCIS